jgi:hypothetical protein
MRRNSRGKIIRPMHAYIASGEYARERAAIEKSMTTCRYCANPFCSTYYGDQPNLCPACKRLWDTLQPIEAKREKLGKEYWTSGCGPGLTVAKEMIKRIEDGEPL